MRTPTTLNPTELETVLTRVAPNGKEYGAARICRMLAEEHSVVTVRVNTTCSVGNISDVVRTGINPRIADLGLYVACTKPPYVIQNRYGQPTGQMLWSFYRNEAANDPEYAPESLENALRRDLSALRAQHPQDYPPSVAEAVSDWEAALDGIDFTLSTMPVLDDLPEIDVDPLQVLDHGRG